MKLQEFGLTQKDVFLDGSGSKPRRLACYAFANVYVWRALYDIVWQDILGSMCIFFKDKVGCFAYLPPLGRNTSPETIDQMFALMDTYNTNSAVSRIENIAEQEVDWYRELGYEVYLKSHDYLSSRATLADLRGDSFKSKRASVNYFTKHYVYCYRAFHQSDAAACRQLYAQWQAERSAVVSENMFRGMLEDGRRCLDVVVAQATEMDCVGRVVETDGEIRAFTFGAEVSPEVFCVIFEVADRTVKGLAQFIFQRVCQEMAAYRYINVMDDSGLENLRRVKMSYHPAILEPAYIAVRKSV